MNIRSAGIADAQAIARVHVSSWHETYTGIMPEAILQRLSIERRQQMWENILSGTDHTIVFVAESGDGEIVGFASAGASRGDFAGYDGELYAIYLLKTAQGTGTGYALFRAIATALIHQGFRAMYLWVLQDNISACRFYERTGGIHIGSKTEPFGDRELVEIAYGWNPIRITTMSKRDET